ncbi:MAG: hypothetical protein JNK09_13100 [Prolixibacteraceae bacterium]|nr:hypothetical protein [Prolixibacteraceae bacterium]
MKTTYLLLALVLLLTSCDWFDSVSKKNDSSSISGSTNIAVNTVGNTFTNSVRVGMSSYSGSISITSVTDGVATVKFQGKIPANYPILSGIKPKYKDASGNLVCEGKFKMTDGGILDYNNKDHKPFVLVKYDAEVGDKYTLEKSDGSIITREVVRKSTTDDYYWNGMVIKTIDVEQSSNIPGVKKIIYFSNHKFGLVAVRVEMEDGSKPQLDLVPSKY